MAKGRIPAVAAAALLAGAALLLWSRGSGGPPAPGVPRERARIQEAARPLATPPSPPGLPREVVPPGPLQPAPPAKDAAPVVLEVTVLRADGTPAAGAEVRVFESDPSGGGICGIYGAPRDLPPRRARADAGRDGKVRIEIPGSLWGGFVTARLGEEADLSQESVHLKAGDRHGFELRLGPSPRVEGIVVDAGGRRVAAESVLLLVPDAGGSALSSIGDYHFAVEPEVLQDGAFRFAPLGKPAAVIHGCGDRYCLRVRASGFLSADCSLAPEAVDGGPLRIRLLRTGPVRGRCVDSAGRAVAEAAVRWRSGTEDDAIAAAGWSGPSATTGEDGRFELEGVPESGGAVDALHDAFATTGAPVPPFDPARGADLGDLLLETGETVRGSVVDDAGAPEAGAVVTAGDRTAVADSEGRFDLRHLPPPPWDLRASEGLRSSPGVSGACRRASMHIETLPAAEVRIALSAARLVLVEIVGEDGDPPEPYRGGQAFWASVDLRREGESLFETTGIWWKTTRIRLRAEGTGPYEVVMGTRDSPKRSHPVTVDPDHETVLRVVLPRPAKGE